jgi:uncharacterized protein
VKLRLDDITAEAKEISFAEPESEINRILGQGPVREYHVEGPIAVSVSYYRAGTDLFFAGEIGARTGAACARCAEEFDASATSPFRFVLAPKAVGPANEHNLKVDDLEFSLYDGDEIDLSPLIREQLILSLPTRPLCREDCRGLCPQCGINLNRETCGCREVRLDSRLAALRALKVSRP